MLRGTVCADGFGVGWYRTTSVRRLAIDALCPSGPIRSCAVHLVVRFAGDHRAVRNGTPGIPAGWRAPTMRV